MLYRYAVYDKEAREWDNFTSRKAPQLTVSLSNTQFETLDAYKVELPLHALWVSRTSLPEGPNAIVAVLGDNTLSPEMSPEELANAGAWDIRLGVGVFLAGVFVGIQSQKGKS